ncbi:tripartite tricarboxylate transporter permease [Bosea sp. BK604]|uniref:tripartite tricarboxylate transporter permease n=1 Tax=Bosea sp. BK604 TaxID=2512180 RepID=UPI001046117B|nr:tripartite tricarboxylate transporter permease [Bosea sp. BK604]TCR70633.1 putative tricarboxylic transport membrane protein [Bosea sp. BK604]
MSAIHYILQGFETALLPLNLLYVFVGTLLGTILGILPGIGPVAGIALLMPVTYGMDPTSALILLCGMYYGAQYGGSATAILINTPGEASSMITCIDGYQMARKGRAGAALAVSAWGSFIAGTLSVIGLAALATALSKLALSFGPAEYFGLMIFSLAAVSALSGKSPGMSIIAVVTGMMIATIGLDSQTGSTRFTLGLQDLENGLAFPIIAIGLFALGEVFLTLEEKSQGKTEIIKLSGSTWMTREDWRRSAGPIVRGGVIGFFLGVLPGIGGVLASIISYATEVRLSKRPQEFGQGAIEGVAGPEAANNAAASGSFVPMLAMGIPGSVTTAVLLGVLIMFGIQPGPRMIDDNPGLFWGLVNSMYVGNVMLLILNLPLIGLFVRILYTPTGILMPLVLVFSVIGIYATDTNVVELEFLLAFGVLGYIFKKIEMPIAPLVLGLVLGDTLEKSFRQALILSGGDPSIFVKSPICLGLLLVSLACFLLPVVLPLLRSREIAESAENA